MIFALFIFLCFTLLIPYVRFILVSKDISVVKKNSVLVIGHRGASGYLPENTLASFNMAIEMGADVLELDVHLTKDDSVVIMHDYEVARTTNGKGEIESMSFNEIRQLDAGSWFDIKYKNEKVPTLAEVLQLVQGRKKVLIELKWPAKGIYTKLVEQVVKIVRQHHAQSWVILQSFENEYLIQANKLAPELTTQQLIFGKSGSLPLYFDRKLKFGQFNPVPDATSVNLYYIYINARFVHDMHALGKKVYAFTPNNEHDMARVINLSVDGIITNYPDKALKLLGR